MRRVLMVTAMAVALMGGTSGVALADSSGPSCAGIESSIAPKPGTSPASGTSEGGRATIAHFIKANFAEFGFNTPGGVYTFFAHVHATSHEGCPE